MATTLRTTEAQSKADSPSADLQDFLDNSVEALHSVGPDGTILWVNRAELEMLGYDADEYVGHNIADFHVDATVVADFLARLLRGETLKNRYARLRCKDGTQKLALVSSSALFRDGRFVSTRCFTRDITSARAAYEAQARLASIVDNSDDAIISKDLDGTVRSWNAAAERIFGYTAEEMVGRSILRIIPPHLHPEERTILSRIANRQRIEHYETKRLRKDGRLVDVSLTVSPVEDHLGVVTGASKIARDVSEHREAQRKKDQFLAILAHELRNPLAPIRNTLALLRVGSLAPEQRDRLLTMADRQMEHLTRLLDDLLDISRLSTGRVELRKELVDFTAISRQTAETARANIAARQHAFNVKLPDGPLWIEADGVRIAQVLNNLLTNAAKYTDPGGKVDFEVACEGAMAVARVRDDGIGFDSTMKDRLFTLFAQDDAAMNRSAGGLGIGLALVREFVERHGGRVDARSEGPMRGSVFTVEFPLAAQCPTGS